MKLVPRRSALTFLIGNIILVTAIFCIVVYAALSFDSIPNSYSYRGLVYLAAFLFIVSLIVNIVALYRLYNNLDVIAYSTYHSDQVVSITYSQYNQPTIPTPHTLTSPPPVTLSQSAPTRGYVSPDRVDLV